MTEAGDSAVRRRALDPTRSFIVQAPAGSGKTELLIQRYLLLLDTVGYPEQVVAVTFTRKAAAEMRARVLQMLDLAHGGAADVPAHRQPSVDLARRVITRDDALGWGLRDRPGRLRIETVDALNGWLAERLPIASGGMAGVTVIENADATYRRAAEDTLLDALTDSTLRQHAARLLHAADNSLERLIGALAAVLPSRDQWLDAIATLDDDSVSTEIERGLRLLAGRRIDAAESAWGPALVTEAFELGGHARESQDAENLGARLSAWQTVARMLLTNGGDWRRRLTVKEGFPPSDKARKERAASLIADLERRPGARASLTALADFPSLTPDGELVERVVAARSLLMRAVAALKVSFENARAVDFLELALGARNALGAVDRPSELLLALDRRIEHVLVDEFQDTSHSQFQLLELLTSGWADGDGRTMFLVGDPMQSIYRFRDADMTLFLRAKAEGIGDVSLEHLVLTSNFRSEAAVVDWVNETFGELFPEHDDPQAGRAAYYPFEASRHSPAGGRVVLHRTASAELDAQHAIVANLATEALSASPDESVAVLVQSRSHLRGLRSALGALGVPVRAVELDSLTESAAVQDLLGLTRALLHPADRIAWLAVLRAPWCGLTWSELHAISAAAGERTILETITSGKAADCVGADAARRIEFVVERLGRGRALRGRYPLARWIECCWQLLDGPATLVNDDDLERSQRFFEALAAATVDGDIPDTAELAQALDVPFSRTRPESDDAPRALEIMTIHRAKGLEFDTVILFGIDRRPRAAETRLLYWQQLREPGERPACLLATMTANGDALTDLLKRADRELDRAERARLLYVAVTRACRHLHLIGHLEDRPDGAPRVGQDTLMAWLAPQFAAAPFADVVDETLRKPPDGWLRSALHALDPADVVPLGPLADVAAGPPVERKDYEWASYTAAHIGTVVHRALQLAGGSAEAGPALTSADRLRRELRLLGVPPTELDEAVARAVETLDRVVHDDTGRWILMPRDGARSELELSVVAEGRITHMRIDRTFVDEGLRWIIDYKTSRHTGGDLDRFVDAEVDRYRAQLEQYALAMRSFDDTPIRVGLYFPMLGVFRDWAPAGCAAD